MSEQMDKQEPATPYRLQEARKKGQVGRSIELLSFTALLTLLLGVLSTAPVLGKALAENVRWWFEHAYFLGSDQAVLRYHADRMAGDVLRLLAPVAVAAIGLVIVVAIAHAGVVISTHPLKPDPNKLNPVAGFKKIFSRKALVELIKLLAKLGLFAAVLAAIWSSLAVPLGDLGNQKPLQIAGSWRQLALTMTWALLLVFALSALFDLWFSKRDFARQMRMSRRDLRDEHKRREGDPEIKAKRRRNQLELIKRLAGMRNVRNADVIITNPTHVAVALRYRPNETALPITITMGRGVMAKSIMMLARRHRIPILRRPALARALHKKGSPGAAIPLDRQSDVASVYRWLMTLPGNKVWAP